MPVQMVRYYKIPTGQNSGIAVVFGEWPGRVLKSRGYHPERICHERVATEAEHQWLKNCYRHQAFLYRDSEALLEDERKVLDERGFEILKTAVQFS